MLNVASAMLLHFFLTTSVNAYSENSFYQPTKSKGERFFMNLRSTGDAERSTRRVFSQTPIRFGGRSDIPPLVGKVMEYEAMLDEDASKEHPNFSEATDTGSMRVGRANSNFVRFGRSRGNNNNKPRRNYNRLARANNSLFLRFGRGRSDFIRFGRSGDYLRKKREITEEDKRGNNNFMRFGKRYDDEDMEYLENAQVEDNEHGVEEKLRDALLLKLISQIKCNMDRSDCERLN